MNRETKHPPIRFVSHLPDLMTPEDYLHDPEPKKLRIRISFTDKGIEILGDSRYVPLLEELLAQAGAKEIEMMLCG